MEDACAYCFASSRRPRHLTIAVGQATYLALVAKGRLGEGHCYIAPAEHVPSMRQVGAPALAFCCLRLDVGVWVGGGLCDPPRLDPNQLQNKLSRPNLPSPAQHCAD